MKPVYHIKLSPEQRQAAALTELQRMIRAGREFPDAAFAAAQNHKVDQGALERAYDEACVKGA